MGLEKIFNKLDGGGPISPFTALIVLLGLFALVVGLTGASAIGLADGISGPVQAGASITTDSTSETVKVTWTTNQNADYLDVAVVNPTTGKTIDSDRLDTVGETVTIDATGQTESVRIVIRAVDNDRSNVIHDAERRL